MSKRKDKPTMVYREEVFTPGRGSVRQTFDSVQFVHWVNNFRKHGGKKRFWIGTIEWAPMLQSETNDAF